MFLFPYLWEQHLSLSAKLRFFARSGPPLVIQSVLIGWGCPGLQMVDLSERENVLWGRERGGLCKHRKDVAIFSLTGREFFFHKSLKFWQFWDSIRGALFMGKCGVLEIGIPLVPGSLRWSE